MERRVFRPAFHFCAAPSLAYPLFVTLSIIRKVRAEGSVGVETDALVRSSRAILCRYFANSGRNSA